MSRRKAPETAYRTPDGRVDWQRYADEVDEVLDDDAVVQRVREISEATGVQVGYVARHLRRYTEIPALPAGPPKGTRRPSETGKQEFVWLRKEDSDWIRAQGFGVSAWVRDVVHEAVKRERSKAERGASAKPRVKTAS